jgi:hypothetical protein
MRRALVRTALVTAVATCSAVLAGGTASAQGTSSGDGAASGVVTTAATSIWGTAEELPGSAELNKGGGAAIESVSCSAAGDCGAGGEYAVASDGVLPMVATETNGSWGDATELPGAATLSAGGAMVIQTESCASPGNCSVGGIYAAGASGDTGQAFVASEIDGAWKDPVPVAVALNAGDDAQVSEVSCGAPGNCGAGGYYTDSDGDVQPFVVSESGGDWGAAQEVLNAGDAGAVATVSCPSAGNCVAGGQYGDDSTLEAQAFVVDESGGAWGSAEVVPGSEELNAGGSAQVNSVSCVSAGDCTAGGNYTDAGGDVQALLVTESGGTWGTAEELPGSGALNTSGDATVATVSCPSAGNCGLGGAYDVQESSSGDPEAGLGLVAGESAGRWSSRELPGQSSLGSAGTTLVESVSCPSAGDCGAGGIYDLTETTAHPFLDTQAGGSWGTAEQVPGLEQLGGSRTAAVLSVSCGSADSCTAGGEYTDASGHGQALVLGRQTCLTSVAFGAYLATAENGSCFVKNGAVYTDTGPVNLNGLDLIPASGTISLNTTHGAEKLQADSATVKIGSFSVCSGPISVNLNGAFELKASGRATFGKLALGGSLDFTVSGSDGFGIKGTVTLPKALGGGTAALSIGVDTANGLRDASIEASDFTIPVKKVKIGLKDFLLSYDKLTDSWTGQVVVGLPTPSGQVGGEIVITDGAVATFTIGASGLNIPLGRGVFLQDIGAGIVLDPPPPMISGTATITAGPAIKGYSAVAETGSLAYIFSDPADFQVKGSIDLLKGSRYAQQLAGGELDYYDDGLVTVSGTAAITLGAASVKAAVSGFVDSTEAFSLTGQGVIKVGKWDISGDAVISTDGVAACGQPFGAKGPSVGFGYLWGGPVDLMGYSCDLGPYTTAPAADTGPAGAAAAVTLPSGLPAASFKITGTKGAAPSGTVTEPDGRTLTISPADQGLFARSAPEYGVAVDAAAGVDYVVIDQPAGGKWTFTAAAGSTVTSVAAAQGLTAPKIAATVSGQGLHRTLAWTASGLDGRTVTFAEQGTGVQDILASGMTGSSGRIGFAPGDGPAGKRTIMATVTLDGLPAQTTAVATYTAPAASSVQVTLTDGGQASGKVQITPAGPTCTAAAVCTLAVPTGQAVTLTPVPASGSRFAWTGGLCVGSGPCQLTLTQLTEVTGTFSP